MALDVNALSLHSLQGVMKAHNVNKLTRCGVTFKFWCVPVFYQLMSRSDSGCKDKITCCRVADWFAQLNNKMGGDLKKIQTVGEYFVEVWKAVGMEDIGEKVCPCLHCSSR